MNPMSSTSPKPVTVEEIVVIDAGIVFGAWARMTNGARRYFSGSMPTRYLAVQATEALIKEAVLQAA